MTLINQKIISIFQLSRSGCGGGIRAVIFVSPYLRWDATIVAVTVIVAITVVVVGTQNFASLQRRRARVGTTVRYNTHRFAVVDR